MFKIFITFISTVQINSEESVPQEGLPDDLTEGEFNPLEEVSIESALRNPDRNQRLPR